MIYIETDRLILRDWKEEDLPVFIKMNSSRKVMEFFPNILSEEESIDLYHRIKNEFEESGYGLYAVEVKENNRFIGFIGFHKAVFISDFTPCTEIAWRLHDSAWGKGYATEGATACLDFGFEKLQFNDIYSFTASVNYRSEAVMKKIGMQKIKKFNHPNVLSDHPLCLHTLYRITKKS